MRRNLNYYDLIHRLHGPRSPLPILSHRFSIGLLKMKSQQLCNKIKLIHFYPIICVALPGFTLLLLAEVLSHIKLCKEDEKDDYMNTNVNWVLPWDVTVIVEQQLEFVDHDGDKLHQLQLG